jgi:hypothetical protein
MPLLTATALPIWLSGTERCRAPWSDSHQYESPSEVPGTIHSAPSRAVGERNEDLHRLRLDVDDLSLPLEDETRWPDGPAVELEIVVQRAPPR